MNDDQVSQWIGQLAQGDEQAAQQIWNRYYSQLLDLARKKLGESPRRVADEEDVVLSAFNSFCQSAAAGRFPQLSDRHDLWKLLVTFTARKAVAHLRREHAEKRGAGVVRGESVPLKGDSSDGEWGLGDILGKEPTPQFAASMAEQCRRLLDCLKEEPLRRVALLKLEGYTNEEIAGQLACSRTTVGRKLTRIRRLWSKMTEADD
jgi:DNA-directed RNA polymerase specialized sigma24 family protein